MAHRPLVSLTLLASTVLAGCSGGEAPDPAGPAAPEQATAAASRFATPLQVPNAAAACAALAGLAVAASDIGEPTSGARVTAATFRPATPDRANASNTAMVQALPDYCQVLADIAPVAASAPVIKVQVNLPASWNGKSLQLGGGGLNGVLVTGEGPARMAGPATPLPLTRGYMTLGTDSGHDAATGVTFAANDEALGNYAYAAYKKTRDVGVQLALAYYGQPAEHAYYIGGSEGGREGLMMAQKYPQDFDGIVAVDPVIRLMGLWTFQFSQGQIQSTPGAWLGGKTTLLHDTVVAACDALDGISDQVVSHTAACGPLAAAALAARRCETGADAGSACFSDAQLATLRWLYTGLLLPFDLANGLASYPGYLFGSEGPAGFERGVIGAAAPVADYTLAGTGGSYARGADFVRYFAARDPGYNVLAYDSASFRARVQELSALMDWTNPDLSAFHARGGKLIIRENLADKGNSPQTGIDYYDAVVETLGQATVDEFFVAFGATGLGHTSNGVDAGTAGAPAYGIPGQSDLLGMIDAWVTGGTAPAEAPVLELREPLPPYALVSSKPMCRFGFYPHFTGDPASGGAEAGNYRCTAAAASAPSAP